MRNRDMQPSLALLRKGEAILWAASLIHGGTPVLEPNRTRLSQASHYFFLASPEAEQTYWVPSISRLSQHRIQLKLNMGLKGSNVSSFRIRSARGFNAIYPEPRMLSEHMWRHTGRNFFNSSKKTGATLGEPPCWVESLDAGPKPIFLDAVRRRLLCWARTERGCPSNQTRCQRSRRRARGTSRGTGAKESGNRSSLLASELEKLNSKFCPGGKGGVSFVGTHVDRLQPGLAKYVYMPKQQQTRR